MPRAVVAALLLAALACPAPASARAPKHVNEVYIRAKNATSESDITQWTREHVRIFCQSIPHIPPHVTHQLYSANVTGKRLFAQDPRDECLSNLPPEEQRSLQAAVDVLRLDPNGACCPAHTLSLAALRAPNHRFFYFDLEVYSVLTSPRLFMAYARYTQLASGHGTALQLFDGHGDSVPFSPLLWLLCPELLAFWHFWGFQDTDLFYSLGLGVAPLAMAVLRLLSFAAQACCYGRTPAQVASRGGGGVCSPARLAAVARYFIGELCVQAFWREVHGALSVLGVGLAARAVWELAGYPLLLFAALALAAGEVARNVSLTRALYACIRGGWESALARSNRRLCHGVVVAVVVFAWLYLRFSHNVSLRVLWGRGARMRLASQRCSPSLHSHSHFFPHHAPSPPPPRCLFVTANGAARAAGWLWPGFFPLSLIGVPCSVLCADRGSVPCCWYGFRDGGALCGRLAQWQRQQQRGAAGGGGWQRRSS
jgi:hypothetical protein